MCAESMNTQCCFSKCLWLDGASWRFACDVLLIFCISHDSHERLGLRGSPRPFDFRGLSGLAVPAGQAIDLARVLTAPLLREHLSRCPSTGKLLGHILPHRGRACTFLVFSPYGLLMCIGYFVLLLVVFGFNHYTNAAAKGEKGKGHSQAAVVFAPRRAIETLRDGASQSIRSICSAPCHLQVIMAACKALPWRCPCGQKNHTNAWNCPDCRTVEEDDQGRPRSPRRVTPAQSYSDQWNWPQAPWVQPAQQQSSASSPRNRQGNQAGRRRSRRGKRRVNSRQHKQDNIPIRLRYHYLLALLQPLRL